MKDRRKELMLSQQDVADRCGIKRSAYREAESGNRNIGVETVEKVAKALEVEPIELLKERE